MAPRLKPRLGGVSPLLVGLLGGFAMMAGCWVSFDGYRLDTGAGGTSQTGTGGANQGSAAGGASHASSSSTSGQGASSSSTTSGVTTSGTTTTTSSGAQTTTSSGGACIPLHEACMSSPTPCCGSGYCDFELNYTCCVPQNGACTTAADCCNEVPVTCTNGICAM